VKSIQDRSQSDDRFFCNDSVVKAYTINSTERFENLNIFFYFAKMLLLTSTLELYVVVDKEVVRLLSSDSNL
jgi:hypothetical protein